MKKKGFTIIIFLTVFMSACGTSLSETALQTAVSEAILTSSVGEPLETQVSVENETVLDDIASLQELDNVKTKLEEAQIALTLQAERINELQSELEQIYPLLTPTKTIEPPESAVTPQATQTPSPSATQSGGLLFNQKYVVAIGSIPVYTYEKENEAGYPIMQKAEPIKKFEAGEKIIVNIYPIRADGGLSFYLVIGPKHGGYYILADDIQDYTG